MARGGGRYVALQGPYDRSATFFGRYERRWPKAGPKALAAARGQDEVRIMISPFRGLFKACGRPLVLRAALLLGLAAAALTAPTSQPRIRAEAYHGLGLQHPTAYTVHIPGLHSATNPES